MPHIELVLKSVIITGAAFLVGNTILIHFNSPNKRTVNVGARQEMVGFFFLLPAQDDCSEVLPSEYPCGPTAAPVLRPDA